MPVGDCFSAPMITAGPLSMQLSAFPRPQSPGAPARWQQLWRQALRDPHA
ncbi:methylase, partial [Stenotrophomonas maltophilia AU12-09]